MALHLTSESTATLRTKFVAAVVSSSEMTTNPAQRRHLPFESIAKNGLLVDAGGLIRRRKRKIGAWLISSRLPAFHEMKPEANQSPEPTAPSGRGSS